MVAKIGRGQNLIGALSYNQLKVDKENGQILCTHKMQETPDGNYSVAQLARSFEPYLIANRKTEKPVLHISLNPDPGDTVSDQKFQAIAQEYMREMGYVRQPFVVFKHTDIERTHIHIVSVCVDEDGRKISDKFERKRSMGICRDLEKKYGLTPATQKEQAQNEKVFRPVDYKTNDLKSQIASVVRHLPKYYRFQSLGAYSALLSLFNITAEEIKGELHGQPKQGLVYFALDENGKKASNPFKASLFGKNAGYAQLQNHFEKSKEVLKSNDAKPQIRKAIEAAVQSATNEMDFKKKSAEKGINAVVRRNAESRIYGITFIDHTSKTVWNGSQLGKNLSANVFNEWWNNGKKQEGTQPVPPKQDIPEKDYATPPHELFSFLGNEDTVYHHDDESSIAEALGGLLPETQGEDYEELAFANRMNKKKKRKKKQ